MNSSVFLTSFASLLLGLGVVGCTSERVAEPAERDRIMLLEEQARLSLLASSRYRKAGSPELPALPSATDISTSDGNTFLIASDQVAARIDSVSAEFLYELTSETAQSQAVVRLSRSDTGMALSGIYLR